MTPPRSPPLPPSPQAALSKLIKFKTAARQSHVEKMWEARGEREADLGGGGGDEQGE